MKIDDFLNCFNQSIMILRKERGIADNGHFVFYQFYKKKLGNYYDYTLKIQYIGNVIDSKNVKISAFNTLQQIVQIPVESLDRDIMRIEIVEKLQQSILTSFLTKVMNKDLYNTIIEGKYGTE